MILKEVRYANSNKSDRIDANAGAHRGSGAGAHSDHADQWDHRYDGHDQRHHAPDAGDDDDGHDHAHDERYHQVSKEVRDGDAAKTIRGVSLSGNRPDRHDGHDQRDHAVDDGDHDDGHDYAHDEGRRGRDEVRR